MSNKQVEEFLADIHVYAKRNTVLYATPPSSYCQALYTLSPEAVARLLEGILTESGMIYHKDTRSVTQFFGDHDKTTPITPALLIEWQLTR